MSAGVLRVLYLPPFPPSISYRPWASAPQGRSLLGMLAERLQDTGWTRDLLVACPHEIDRGHVEKELAGLGIPALLCPGTTRIEILAAVAAAFPDMDLVIVSPESIFSPPDLPARLLELHQRTSSHFTWVEDLPEVLAPEVVNSDLLVALWHAVEHSGLAVAQLREAVQAIDGVRQGRTPASVRLQSLRASDAYGIPLAPEARSMMTEEDACCARQALRLATDDVPFAALRAWKDAAFEPLSLDSGMRGVSDEGPRILFLSPGSIYSGAEECLRGLVEGLGSRGYRQFAIVGFEGVLADRLRTAGCRVFCPNLDFTSDYFGDLPTDSDEYLSRRTDLLTRFAAEVLDTVQPHWIHCNGGTGDAFIRLAQKRGIPMFCHVRTIDYTGFEHLHEASARLIAESEFVKSRLVSAGRSADRIEVVHAALDPDTFSPGTYQRSAMRRKFGLPADALAVLMIARITPYKRHDLMIQAFSELYRVDPGARLVFVGDYGDAHLAGGLRAAVVREGIGEATTWLPFQDDIRMVEAIADVLVLPSDGEPFGICVIEAMSQGIPVVVSDAGGTAELIEDGISGLLMEGGNAASLATALTRLALDPVLRSRLGANARLRVQERFSMEQHVSRVVTILHEATCPAGSLPTC